jgi:HEPN domain-containing protein
MSPEPGRVAEVREWLEKAALDLRGATIDLQADPPLIEDVLFHCQQVAEKVLKAFLVWNDVRIRKTHSIEEIGRACCAIDADLLPIVDEAVPLTEYAWAFRYPGALPKPDLEEAVHAMDVANRLIHAITQRLPPNAVPSGLA